MGLALLAVTGTVWAGDQDLDTEKIAVKFKREVERGGHKMVTMQEVRGWLGQKKDLPGMFVGRLRVGEALGPRKGALLGHLLPTLLPGTTSPFSIVLRDETEKEPLLGGNLSQRVP